MNLIKPHISVGIQLEELIPHNFKINLELTVLTVMGLQLRALRSPWSATILKAEAKTALNDLCFLHIPVCEMIILIQ